MGRITKYDLWALAAVVALFVAWLLTGSGWLRYLVLGVAFFYLFVVRIVVHNLKSRR